MIKQPTYSTDYSNTEFLGRLFLQFPSHISQDILLVNINQQRLYHIRDEALVHSYLISSALNGTGSRNGSGKTPLGAHCIQEKFGDDVPLGSIFKGRVNTGNVAEILTTKNTLSNADNITSRIFWLSGLEAGKNQGDDIDSYQRYIYIHGTDEEGRLGQPASHGCIRMANHDVIDLFEPIKLGTFVYIFEQ